MTTRRFHFVGGLLRSGSTLLCNILNQNPRFYVSSTSPLPNFIGSLTSVWSRSPEVKGMLIRDRESTLKRLRNTARGVAQAWYEHIPDEREVVLDKSRIWNYSAAQIADIWPDAKLITIVRDLRSIIGSIEKQHCRTAVLDEAGDLLQKTVFKRTLFQFQEGPLAVALRGLEDLIRREPENWVWLRYEDLCAEPETQLRRLYDELHEPYFEHDLNNIKNVAEDVDELYSLKFPHQGDGPLRPLEARDWSKWISQDIEEEIEKGFGFYSSFFRYAERK